jgi:putative ATPase
MIEGGRRCEVHCPPNGDISERRYWQCQSNSLVMANACFEAVNKIGYPEASIILSQCVVYLASSAKSNAAVVAISEAQAAVRHTVICRYRCISVMPYQVDEESRLRKGIPISHIVMKTISRSKNTSYRAIWKKIFEPGKNARKKSYVNF